MSTGPAAAGTAACTEVRTAAVAVAEVSVREAVPAPAPAPMAAAVVERRTEGVLPCASAWIRCLMVGGSEPPRIIARQVLRAVTAGRRTAVAGLPAAAATGAGAEAGAEAGADFPVMPKPERTTPRTARTAVQIDVRMLR